MKYIPSNFKLSNEATTLADVAYYYDSTSEAIWDYYNPSGMNPALVGLSMKEVKGKRDKLLRELSIECGMMLMSAVEAAFRTDFILRCRKSRKRTLSGTYKGGSY